MIRSLVQFTSAGERGVAALDVQGAVFRLTGVSSTFDLAQEAVASSSSLASLAEQRLGEAVDLSNADFLLPIDRPEPEKVLVSGTGLTHLGSAEGRDKMHKAASAGDALTDSMRMFLMGVDGGKPVDGARGVEPEWFYKGDGSILVSSGQPLTMPCYAGDGGEEPEIAGVYLIGENGTAHRLGFVLGNEFSDHVTERQNYLLLASSKLRQAGIGPELLLGELPDDVRGMSRIRRGEAVLWEKPFLSGEANMSHSIANLEHHHFKHPQFRRPDMLHVHFFGTATLSFSDAVATQAGDVFEIEADAFQLPLRNPLRCTADEGLVKVAAL